MTNAPADTPQPPSTLDAFVEWLSRHDYETLTADITLLRYLDSFPRLEEPTLRIRQLGTRLTLEHSGPGARGMLILPHVSMRLQSALVSFMLDKQPAAKARLWDTARMAEHQGSSSSPPPSLL